MAGCLHLYPDRGICFFINRVHFDQDMLHMNYMPEKLRKAEATLNVINAYSLRSVYLITDGTNLESALRKQESVNEKSKLQQEKIIKKHSGAFRLLISDSLQKERIHFGTGIGIEMINRCCFQTCRSPANRLVYCYRFRPFPAVTEKRLSTTD
jgi:hypothetical protein